MSKSSLLNEQRKLKQRIAASRKKAESTAGIPKPIDTADKLELLEQAMSRRRKLDNKIRTGIRKNWLEQIDPVWFKAAAAVTLCLLILFWNLQRTAKRTVIVAASEARPQIMAHDDAQPAREYADAILESCRRYGFQSLDQLWASGIPGYLKEISANSLAPYLAADNPHLEFVSAQQRKNSVFVRYELKNSGPLTCHLRKSKDGQLSLVTVE